MPLKMTLRTAVVWRTG